jgi:CheY-like chemotaxis protein/predicted Ser/Thr protein kinase
MSDPIPASGPLPVPARRRTPRPDGPLLRVLLVEDNPADRVVVEACVGEVAPDIQLEWAGDLVSAMACLARRYPDCILLDLSLPDSSGLDTFITMHARAPQTPVVVLSGEDGSETVLEIVRMGAQDFLVKGEYTPGHLARAVRFAVARERLRARHRLDGTTEDVGGPALPLHPELPALPLAAIAGDPGVAVTTNRFAISHGLGTGGSAEVVLAHQVNLGRDVAVKFLRAAKRDPFHAQQFQAEARVTAWLEHPCVVPVYDIGEHFFVMRRVSGATLERMIEVAARDSTALVLMIEALVSVCDAVLFAHSRGILHRDIKPSNIMVGDFGQVLLMDWGLAVAMREDPDCPALPLPQEPTRLCAGTVGYMAPEVACAERPAIGPATDLFLLGATLYAVLAGRPPYDDGTTNACLAAAARCRWQPLGRDGTAVPALLVQAQQRAMAADPGDRGTVEDFAADLRSWLALSAAPRAQAVDLGRSR